MTTFIDEKKHQEPQAQEDIYFIHLPIAGGC